jgi:hypothetical protein
VKHGDKDESARTAQRLYDAATPAIHVVHTLAASARTGHFKRELYARRTQAGLRSARQHGCDRDAKSSASYKPTWMRKFRPGATPFVWRDLN